MAGIAAGFAALERPDRPPWTLVLAVDQPAAAQAVMPLLLAAARAGADADLLCHRDPGGHPQWLLAAYRSPSLASTLAGVGTGHGTSVRRLVDGLTITEVGEGARHVGDIDTWADHESWQARLREAGGRMGEGEP